MGNLLLRRRSQDPRTISEAKTEIKNILQRIQEHYDAINRMRLEDRNKWKYLNRKVEELEVVKARALKLERKRLRDTERAKERAQLEANMKTSFLQMSRELETTSYGSKKQHIVYPNLQKQREEASQKSAKSDTESMLKTAEQIREEDQRLARAPVKRSRSPNKVLDVDPTQLSVGRDGEQFELISISGTGSMKSPRTPRTPSSDIEELFIEIDTAMSRKEDSGPTDDINVQKGRLVSVTSFKDENPDDVELNNFNQMPST